ncbi:hypothetical protein K435DRAFT_959640 [Dendrothele bispora CBS 962.96]|uniref:ASX DEUBAD domain-containing protein n=1 Tax=Dendrothele bispora (strain CBS 962.96) TaxID=1314807 RepID=A0A4S8MWL7_DENBC|nr:hypothetical protein K435DRAFT_959640 [Dendrothele bispora CBS 962.96]
MPPRRSTRQHPPSPDASSSSRPKRKIEYQDPSTNNIDELLKHPKSILTNIDISELINASIWEILSADCRERLVKLLPPTAFIGYTPTYDAHHPSQSDSTDAMDVDTVKEPSADTLDASVFTDSHFLAAARTFQDHIYSGWLTDSHKEKVRKYEDGIRDGTLAAPWKDEEWERDNAEDNDSTAPAASSSASRKSALDVRLNELAKNSVIRVGDIIAYKRAFTAINLVVEKDVLIYDIKSKGTITVLLESGVTQHLPAHLLQPGPTDAGAPTQSMEVTTPSMLETGILDLDGRVERSRRPNGNAWKCFTIWRWRDDTLSGFDDNRGGRENHGTLYYLRQSYASDR